VKRAALALGTDDDEVGAQVGRDIQELVPRGSAPDEEFHVNALAFSARASNRIGKLRAERRGRVNGRCQRRWRVLERADTCKARLRLGRETDGMFERSIGRLAEVRADHDPSRAFHSPKKYSRLAITARQSPANLCEIFVEHHGDRRVAAGHPSSPTGIHLVRRRSVCTVVCTAACCRTRRLASALRFRASRQPFELAVKRCAVHPEDLRGPALVAADDVHDAFDIPSFDLCERDELRRIIRCHEHV